MNNKDRLIAEIALIIGSASNAQPPRFWPYNLLPSLLAGLLFMTGLGLGYEYGADATYGRLLGLTEAGPAPASYEPVYLPLPEIEVIYVPKQGI